MIDARSRAAPSVRRIFLALARIDLLLQTSLIPFIPKPRTLGLQPQLALDMIFDNHESGGSAQKETSRLEFCLRLLERSEIQPAEKKKKMSRLRLDLGIEVAVLRAI